MSKFEVGDAAWVPATSTQARYTIPSDLGYGNNRAAWLPVVIKKIEQNDMLLSNLVWDKNLDIKCKAAMVLPRDDADSPLDLSKLKHHNDASINHSLAGFFARMQFTVKIAKYFVYINPGNRKVSEVGCHRNAPVDMLPYLNDDSQAPLSIYSFADTAYRKVTGDLLNQTIVFRGCSGSGKTEASKHVIQYLLYAESPQRAAKSADYASYTPLGHSHNPIIDMNSSSVSKAILAGCAVLDNFGSAPSGQNPTSSRGIRHTKFAYDLGESY